MNISCIRLAKKCFKYAGYRTHILYGLSFDPYHNLDDNGSNLPRLTSDEGQPKLETHAILVIQIQAIARYMCKS